jgi:imipenem/basic amino acid-specific outer membrane pore
MKIAKMSLAAAMLLGANAFAIENVKVSGDAKLFYDTASFEKKAGSDITGTPTAKVEGDLFDRQASNGQVALDLGFTADLIKGVSAGATLAVTDTLGLEQNLVGGTWAGPIAWAGAPAGGVTGLPGNVATQWWFSEAWVAATLGKTTAKVGRQFLDTPLAFTETWNIAANSFTSAVLLNQDVPDTTFVVAYVGQSNGAAAGTVGFADSATSPFNAYTTYNNTLNVAETAGIVPFGTAAAGVGGEGAYAIGVVNNSWKPLTAQAWYYDVVDVATAYWLQADLAMDMGLLVGLQYTDMDPSDRLLGGAGKDFENSNAFAVMAGWSFGDVATVKAAYSQTDDEGVLNIQNTATGTQSKLYTEAWWNYGYVGMPGTSAFMVAADGEIKDVLGWFAVYNNMNVEPKDIDSETVQEFTLGVNKSFGALDTSVAYIHADIDKDENGGWISLMQNDTGDYTEDRLQVYLTLNF